MVSPYQLPIEQSIASLIEDALVKLGYEIVRIKLTSNNGSSNLLQIMLDRIDGQEINIDDCEKASRQVSAIMDVEDPIESEYNLEVSSPGIDRPLTRQKDFEKYKGFHAKISTNTPIEQKIKDKEVKRKNFKGQIIDIADQHVSLALDDSAETFNIDLDNINNAKLILTDELIDFHSLNTN